MQFRQTISRFAAFAALVVAPVLSGCAANSSGAHVFARRDNGTNIVSRLVPDGTDVVTAAPLAQALAGKADCEKVTYSDSFDVYERYAGDYVFLTGLQVSSTVTNSSGFGTTIYGQTDAGYDHGGRPIGHAFGRFYEFLVYLGQDTNGLFVAVLNSHGDLDRWQPESDPRVSGASFTAGDYKYVYNGLSTNTVVYSDRLAAVERTARAAAACASDAYAVSTNAFTKATNAVAQVTGKTYGERVSRRGTWHVYYTNGAEADTLSYDSSAREWRGTNYRLRYEADMGGWVYAQVDGSFPNMVPGAVDAVVLEAPGLEFSRTTESAFVVYTDDLVPPDAEAVPGEAAEASAVYAALSEKVSEYKVHAGDWYLGDWVDTRTGAVYQYDDAAGVWTNRDTKSSILFDSSMGGFGGWRFQLYQEPPDGQKPDLSPTVLSNQLACALTFTFDTLGTYNFTRPYPERRDYVAYKRDVAKLISDSAVVSVNGKTGAVSLSASDVGALGNDGDQNLNGSLSFWNGILAFEFHDAWMQPAIRVWNNTIEIPAQDGTLALAASGLAAGHLAALDSWGNPTDSGIAQDDVVTRSGFKAELSKALTGKTMPVNPSDADLRAAVSNIWEALGGSFR